MHNFIFRRIMQFKQNYWFWPSAMTAAAVLLGFLLPYLDARLGSDWIQSVDFIRASGVDGARSILTTLAGATLGVAGVAFSVTIVAVSFASSNYGPRLIGNFMGDRKNQVVLGVFVATFVYCITVLSTVHASAEASGNELDAFVPQLSVFLALLLTLAAVGALIAYIHHIPESINIMNLTAKIGDKLHSSIVAMLDREEARDCDEGDAVDVTAWRAAPADDSAALIRAKGAGFLQQIDLDSLTDIAREHEMQIVLHRAPGDFLVADEIVMSVTPGAQASQDLPQRIRKCYTQGANRTDFQDILFLSDQLVEVLGRALSTGVNDPHTAVLCLNWLRAGLVSFARRPPVQPAMRSDPVVYQRVTFEDMLDRSFDRMRQYIAGDRSVTLHALRVLTDIAEAASRQAMADACLRQMRELARSAQEQLPDPVGRDEVEAALTQALKAVAARDG